MSKLIILAFRLAAAATLSIGLVGCATPADEKPGPTPAGASEGGTGQPPATTLKAPQ